MNDSLANDNLALAAEYLQSRRHMQFYIGMACLIVAVLLPSFLLFPLAASGSVAWRMIAAIVTITIWSLAWVVYVKANSVTGFLVAGSCVLIAAGCIWYAAITSDPAKGVNGVAFAAAVVFSLVALRVTRVSWLVFRLSRHPRIGETPAVHS